MPPSIDDAVARIGRACTNDPIDWSVIRGIALELDSMANTSAQRAAAGKLKDAATKRQVERAAHDVQRAFLEGKPDADGWPRRF